MVERRSSAKGSYGQGVKAPMQLRQLIHELQQGNTGLYMSTQEVRPPPGLNTAVRPSPQRQQQQAYCTKLQAVGCLHCNAV